MTNQKEIAENRGYSYKCFSKKVLFSASIILILFFLIILFSEGKAKADIYQYKDKSGNLVLTDTPPGNVENREIIKYKDGRSSRSSGIRDIEKDLVERYRPKSEIEKASLSTVTIKTSIGQGSGFFINENGYILTNKHVLRVDEKEMKKTEEFMARVDNRIEDDEATITEVENRLRRMRSDLDDYKAAIDRMTDPNAQKIAMQKYRSQSEQYDFSEAQLRKRKNEFEEKTSRYRQDKGEFTKKARMAKHDRQFIVILKDKTELEANLVSVSNDHDLALLKIDGCKSPYIQQGVQKEIIQGMAVFAIGSPLGLGDSVSSGVVSGYDNDYIRTDAKIYPGNSGGPLINAEGKVVGINTLKLITHKFEGMGFAIPVRRAFQDFNKYLNNDQ